MTDRETFLEIRRHGIGGSDVAAILGLSKFRTALDVFNDKTEKAAPQEETEAMHWGTLLEDVVAKEFAARTGLKVQRITKTLRGDRLSIVITQVFVQLGCQGIFLKRSHPLHRQKGCCHSQDLSSRLDVRMGNLRHTVKRIPKRIHINRILSAALRNGSIS